MAEQNAKRVLARLSVVALVFAASSLGAQTPQPSFSPGSSDTFTIRPGAAGLPSQASPMSLSATASSHIKVYYDTSLTACPSGEKLKYFYYHQDTADFRGSSWCGAAAADIDWANRSDPVRSRIPYILESCQPGVVWYYSHAFSDGSRYYSPGYRDINMVCEVDACPVPPLTPITDALTLQHEAGEYERSPDLERVSDAVKAGTACILQKVSGLGSRARPTSGFRPPAYQTHLREVWDKWQLLRDDVSGACRDTKAEVQAEWIRHQLIRQPVLNSKHSRGNAVDIAGVPDSSADAIAAECNMFRPEPVKDRVHFEPR